MCLCRKWRIGDLKRKRSFCINSSACVSCSSGFETGIGALFAVAFFALKILKRVVPCQIFSRWYSSLSLQFVFCFVFYLESSKLVAPYGEIKPPDYTTGTPCLFLPSWNAMQAGKEKNEGSTRDRKKTDCYWSVLVLSGELHYSLPCLFLPLRLFIWDSDLNCVSVKLEWW